MAPTAYLTLFNGFSSPICLRRS